jgi:glycosyltransferase involved in cell wall biosynthesis
MMAVSVVIPCFNAARWIGETLESVMQQRLPDLEVIVVDDGSTDASADLVARDFSSARLVRVPNGGASRARNLGTALASGGFIQYLDADDLLAPGKLEAQLGALVSSGADVAYGDWQELRLASDGTYAPGRRVMRSIDGDADIALLTDFWCPPAAYLFRRSIVEHAGGWDEQQSVVEDVRLALTCALQGARFVYCPGLAASYRVHTSNSLSTRDPTSFTRGCLRNARTVEECWKRNGGLDDARTAALLRSYGHVARASFGRDNSTFEAAYCALNRLDPSYVPTGPWQLALASRLFGYRSAEALAVRYRRAKRTMKSIVQVVER